MLLRSLWWWLARRHVPTALPHGDLIWDSVFSRFVLPACSVACSGHFHLSHNYADSISVVGGTAFVLTGVIGECNRDGFRHSRLLKGGWVGRGRRTRFRTPTCFGDGPTNQPNS